MRAKAKAKRWIYYKELVLTPSTHIKALGVKFRLIFLLDAVCLKLKAIV
jgi:hypothetical protein